MDEPSDSEQEIQIVGLDDTEQHGTLVLDAYQGAMFTRLTVDRMYISNSTAPVTTRQVLPALPLVATAHISGQQITELRGVRSLNPRIQNIGEQGNVTIPWISDDRGANVEQNAVNENVDDDTEGFHLDKLYEDDHVD